MKENEGELLQRPELNIVWVGDLVEHEGPILALFRDATQIDQYYLASWVDLVEGHNRWAIVPFDKPWIASFFDRRASLREIFRTAAQVYLYDYLLELSPERVFKVDQDLLPEGYLPGVDSYYSESAYSQFAADFKTGWNRAGPESEPDTD